MFGKVTGIISLSFSALMESFTTNGEVFMADHFTSFPLDKTAFPERLCVFSIKPVNLVKPPLSVSFDLMDAVIQLLDTEIFDFIFFVSAVVISDFGAVISPPIFHLYELLLMVKS